MFDLDRNVFFAHIRNGPFPGRLSQSQVDGMNHLLDVWAEFGTDDTRHLAYTLATNFHETGGRMQPVRETFASSDKEARRNLAHRKYGRPAGPHGQAYYGRGDVQLTWYENYLEMGEIIGIPLAEKPDLALDPKVSKRILVEGMTLGKSNRGDFTGKALSHYFNDTTDDPEGARRIVNGTDKAKLIAGYYYEFLDAVREAVQAHDEPRFAANEPEVSPAKRPPKTDSITWGGVLSAAGGGVATVTALVEQIKNPYALAALAVIVVGTVLVVRGRFKIVRETGR